MLPIVTELRFDEPYQMLARPQGDISPEIEPISHARKSARYMTVEVTVDAVMRGQKARFYVVLQVQEIIEWGMICDLSKVYVDY
jgi:hypothetical protein